MLRTAAEDEKGALRSGGHGADEDVHALQRFEGTDGEGDGVFQCRIPMRAVGREPGQVDAEGNRVVYLFFISKDE